jgi:hypothetical protein
MKDVIMHVKWQAVSLSHVASKLPVEFKPTGKQLQCDVIVASLPWNKQNLMPRGDQLITEHPWSGMKTKCGHHSGMEPVCGIHFAPA